MLVYMRRDPESDKRDRHAAMQTRWPTKSPAAATICDNRLSDGNDDDGGEEQDSLMDEN